MIYLSAFIGFLMLIWWMWIFFLAPRICGDIEIDWNPPPPPVKKAKPAMPVSIEPDMDTVLMVMNHRAHMEGRGI